VHSIPNHGTHSVTDRHSHGRAVCITYSFSHGGSVRNANQRSVRGTHYFAISIPYQRSFGRAD
jgi:hypothetical protein